MSVDRDVFIVHCVLSVSSVHISNCHTRNELSLSLSLARSEEGKKRYLQRQIPMKRTKKQNVHRTYCNCRKVKKGQQQQLQMMARISFFCHSTSRTSNWFIFIYNVILHRFFPTLLLFKWAAIVPFTLRCFFHHFSVCAQKFDRDTVTQVL